MNIQNNCVIHTMVYNRTKKLWLFLSGDFKFLCKMYGLSGASGTCIMKIVL